MQPIDVTMVAGRRPEVAAEALASLGKNLLATIPVRKVFLNIDPLWGDEGDAAAVEMLVRSTFASCSGGIEVTSPEVPSLTAALKSLWRKPQTAWFLHLEDDWLLDIAVDPERLERRMRDPRLGQIRFSWWYPTKRFSRPVEFGTMPAFNRTAFARGAADLMDPAMHPERQIYNGANPALSAWASQWKPAYYGSMFTPAAIRDLGGPWRIRNGFTKSTHAA